jgi:drug/metabolite transporter (DMT)-like permease
MLRRRPLQLSRRDFGVLAGSGTLLWLGGNGLVSWAAQRADSGLAALVIASTPIWVALIEAVLDRRAPSLLLVGSLLLGFAGIGLLSAPQILDGTQADLWAVVGLLGAALSWGSGTLLQQRLPVSVPPRVSSAYQHLFGGVGLALVALLVRDPVPRPSPDAWLAWGYLVIFGSVIAFTSYIQALRLLPTTVVVTYAYVNPVIAVVLGWAVLGERLTFWTALGAPLVLLGVAGVFRDRMRQRARIRAQMARVEAG